MLLVLWLHPMPFCIDFELPDSTVDSSAQDGAILLTCLVAGPLFAGLLSLRRGWLVPITAVGALMLSQSIGGVSEPLLLESGAFLLMFGLPITLGCFGLGRLFKLQQV